MCTDGCFRIYFLGSKCFRRFQEMKLAERNWRRTKRKFLRRVLDQRTCVTAVEFILCVFTDYSLLLALHFNVNPEITFKRHKSRLAEKKMPVEHTKKTEINLEKLLDRRVFKHPIAIHFNLLQFCPFLPPFVFAQVKLWSSQLKNCEGLVSKVWSFHIPFHLCICCFHFIGRIYTMEAV